MTATYTVTRKAVTRQAREGHTDVVARSTKRLDPVFCEQIEEELNRVERERERIAALNRELQKRVAQLEAGA